jgi:3'(2'), 5'-bisphosphate nucleotidase
MKVGNNSNTALILLNALLASKKAADSILEVYNTAFSVEQKDDNSPLTAADRRSHQIIHAHLSALFYANFPILSEEGKAISFDERKKWNYFWLVDPLDGTKEFINRNGEFTVNIALIYKDAPVLGVVHIPVKKTFFFGAKGMGAYKLIDTLSTLDSDNKPGPDYLEYLKKSSARLDRAKKDGPANNKTSKLRVVCSRSHMSAETEVYVDGLRKHYGEIDFISAGSSLKFCLIAESRADIYPRFGRTMEWDTAAGQFLVEESGGKVIQTDTGRPLKYNKRTLLNPPFVAYAKP